MSFGLFQQFVIIFAGYFNELRFGPLAMCFRTSEQEQNFIFIPPIYTSRTLTGCSPELISLTLKSPKYMVAKTVQYNVAR